jgi:hypothetical protein
VPVNYVYYVLAKSPEDAVAEAKATFMEAAADAEPGVPVEVTDVDRIVQSWRDALPWSKKDHNPGEYTVEEFVKGEGKDYD